MLSPQNFVENVGRKIKLVDEIDKKYVNQNKPGNDILQNREGLQQDMIFPFFNKTKNSLSESHPPQKNVFFL